MRRPISKFKYFSISPAHMWNNNPGMYSPWRRVPRPALAPNVLGSSFCSVLHLTLLVLRIWDVS